MDELHTYVGAKKRLVALGGCGSPCTTIPPRRIGCLRCRHGREGVKSDTLQAVMSDYGKPYEHRIPQAIHTQSQAETYTVAGYNSHLRHFLARLRRKSKCDSKGHRMLLCSVMLFMSKVNGTLEAILF